MTPRYWSHVLAVVAMASLIGCVQDRHSATSPQGASSAVAPDKNRATPVDQDFILRTARQRYPDLAAQSNQVPVLWFVADGDNRVLATHRNDAAAASGSFDDIRRQFPNVDLSHLSAVQVVYHGGELGKSAPVTVVWARTGSNKANARDASVAAMPTPMRATVASLVTQYYGATTPTGRTRNLWFQVDTSGVVVAHGEGMPAAGMTGSRIWQFAFAPTEVLPDSVRAVWVSQ